MGNQWLEKYHNNFECSFAISSSDTWAYVMPIVSAERQSQILQLIFEIIHINLNPDFVRECRSAAFRQTDCNHKAAILVTRNNDDIHGYVLNVVKPIETYYYVGRITGKVNLLRLDLECSNLDEIDFRYFRGQKTETITYSRGRIADIRKYHKQIPNQF